MKILEVIDTLLKRGCGTNLDKVLQSDRYKKLRARQDTLFRRLKPKSDTGIALRTGHLEMGRLLNTVGERVALQTAPLIKPAFGVGIKLRALIECVGEELIESADECLPKDIQRLASDWRRMNAKEQLATSKELYLEFRSTGQLKDREDLTYEKALRDLADDWKANSHDEKKVLPKEYGPWHPDTCVANCQGKTQMLAAFARRAGIVTLAVHPVELAGDHIRHVRKLVMERLIADIKEREIQFPDSLLMSSLQGEVLLQSRNKDVFHVCPAFKIRDGRFALVDSHALNWGIFGTGWDMRNIARLLRKYAEALPGLTLLASDTERTAQRLAGEAMHMTKEMLARSRALEQSAGTAESISEFIYTLAASSELPFIFDKVDGDMSLIPKDAETARQFWWMVAARLTLGDDWLDPSTSFRAATDQTFIPKKVGSLATVHHMFVMNELKNQWTDSGELLHPVCAFSRMAYSCAISAITSLVVDNSDKETHRFFLDYSFDEVTLCNAVSVAFNWFAQDEEQAVGEAAARTLSALPFIHTLCKQKLKVLQHRKEHYEQLSYTA